MSYLRKKWSKCSIISFSKLLEIPCTDDRKLPGSNKGSKRGRGRARGGSSVNRSERSSNRGTSRSRGTFSGRGRGGARGRNARSGNRLGNKNNEINSNPQTIAPTKKSKDYKPNDLYSNKPVYRNGNPMFGLQPV